MAELRIEKRLIDYVGLNAKGLLESWLAYPKDIQLALALLQGMGPDGAKLVNVDATGNLLISGGSVGLSVSIDREAGALVNAPTFDTADSLGATGGQFTAINRPQIFNGLNYDRQRSASSVTLAAQSGLGAALASGPGEWSIPVIVGAGSQASVTRAAGGAGVRHVCKSLSFSAGAVVAPALTFLSVALRDGASGAGSLLWQAAIIIAAATGQSVPPTGWVGLNIVGSANTAMTLEWSAGLANLLQGVSLTGYDAS